MRHRWSLRHLQVPRKWLIRSKTNPSRTPRGIRRRNRRSEHVSNMWIMLTKLGKLKRSKMSMTLPRRCSPDTWSQPRRETEKCTNPSWSSRSQLEARKGETRVQEVLADITAQKAWKLQGGARSRRVAKTEVLECQWERHQLRLRTMLTTFMTSLPWNLRLNQCWRWPKQCAPFSPWILKCKATEPTIGRPSETKCFLTPSSSLMSLSSLTKRR